MNYKVLITTSGLGSRLGELTDYTNKSLVRIGNKPALSIILESYDANTEFVITLGHYGNHVKEFLQVTYPNYNFTFVEVDNYQGQGSSLGYSILKAKDHLQQPFIFNACDTILHDKTELNNCISSNYNFCVGGNREDVSQYATLLVNDDQLVKIKSKGELNFDYAYIGVCGIQDYELFWSNLENLYNENPLNTSLNDTHVINKMIQKTNFKVIEVNSWLDIGNVGELEKTRKFYDCFAEVLEKREESIYFFQDFVVKFFHDSSICKNRILRSQQLNGLTPNIISSGQNFYKYKKVKGKLLADDVTDMSFFSLLEWAKKNLWIQNPIDNFNQLCYAFYFEKTKNRVNKFLKNNNDVYDSINSYNVPPIHVLLDSIDIDWLCDGDAVNFHGDFILDNILQTKDGFCLLDWRQDFAGILGSGDIYYDLAKLNHNLTINHKIINKQLYNHSQNNCYVLCNSKMMSCKKILKNFVIDNGYDYKKVQVLTALIWINMAPLHEYPFNVFLFNFGKLNLFKELKND